MRWVKAYGAALLFLLVGAFAHVSERTANGPDREVTLVREYHSKVPLRALGLALLATTNWPEWHYHATEAQVVDGDGKPLPMNYQFVETGSLVHLTLEPKGEARKRFKAFLHVKEFVPERTLHMEWQSDSKGRIRTLVDNLEWRIDLEPVSDGTLVRSQIWARTHGARARWFASFWPQFMLHQLGMANIERFVEFTRPSPVIPIPAVQR